jgi:hypothetical protein
MCQINDLSYVYTLYNFFYKKQIIQSHRIKNKHSHEKKQILKLTLIQTKTHIHIHTHKFY